MGKHSAPEAPNPFDAIFGDDGRRSPFGFCVGIEDGLDGYCVHDENCRYVGKGWSGPNSDCVGGSGHTYRGSPQPWGERGYAFKD